MSKFLHSINISTELFNIQPKLSKTPHSIPTVGNKEPLLLTKLLSTLLLARVWGGILKLILFLSIQLSWNWADCNRLSKNILHTSLAVPGALTHCLQHRTAWIANRTYVIGVSNQLLLKEFFDSIVPSMRTLKINNGQLGLEMSLPLCFCMLPSNFAK